MKAIFHNERQSGAPLEATAVPHLPTDKSIISERQPPKAQFI